MEEVHALLNKEVVKVQLVGRHFEILPEIVIHGVVSILSLHEDIWRISNANMEAIRQAIHPFGKTGKKKPASHAATRRAVQALRKNPAMTGSTNLMYRLATSLLPINPGAQTNQKVKLPRYWAVCAVKAKYPGHDLVWADPIQT